MGEYGVTPYLLLVGAISAGLVVVQARSVLLGGPFLVLFLGFGLALCSIRPIAQVPVEMRWVYDFVCYTVVCSVFAAGAVIERQMRGR